MSYWQHHDPSRYETKIIVPCTTSYVIVIYKGRHLLQLVREKKVIREYCVSVRNELPDRLLEDDAQTPEGVFHIWQMAIITEPPWTRWMAFDTTEKAKTIFVNEYPNGLNILAEYERINGTINNDADIRLYNNRNPSTPMLRGFGIHGGGFNPHHDWTLGCPALNDRDVIELYDFILQNPNGGIGTTVIIQD